MLKRDGHCRITSFQGPLSHPVARRKLIDWSLTAIRRDNGEKIDIVEMHSEVFYHLVTSPLGPLKTDTEVTLELFHPETFERRTTRWKRRPSF